VSTTILDFFEFFTTKISVVFFHDFLPLRKMLPRMGGLMSKALLPHHCGRTPPRVLNAGYMLLSSACSAV
jgi:hypothetical protein